MTPGRTQRDLRRLRGEESAGFPERRPSQPDQPPSSSLHPPLPQTSRTRGPPPAQRSRPFLSFACRAPCPPTPALSRPSLAPRDSHLGLGLPQCPAPAPSPFAHLPPGTRGPAPCPVGAPSPPGSQPPAPWSAQASTPPRPRSSSGEPELSQRTAFGELPCLGTGPSPGAGRRPPTPK